MKKRGISKHFFQAKELGKYGVGDRRIVRKIFDGREIDTKISVYDDRVRTWFLDIAEYLAVKRKTKIDGEDFDTNEAGFVILQIALSYIEGNQQYRDGSSSRDNSRNVFIKGIQRIFKRKTINSRKHLGEFYDQVRCGLFHDGMTKKKVTINGESKYSIKLTANEILINPYKFLDAVCKDFNEYIRKLRNKRNKTLRSNFEERCKDTG